MKRSLLFTTLLCGSLYQAAAADYIHQPSLRLTQDTTLYQAFSLEDRLDPATSAELLMTASPEESTGPTLPAPEPNKMATQVNVRPYRFKDDMTYVGVPLFVAGIIAKSEKASFRQNTQDQLHTRTRLLTNFPSLPPPCWPQASTSPV